MAPDVIVTYVIQYRKPSWRDGHWEDAYDVSRRDPAGRQRFLDDQRITAGGLDILVRLIERETREKVIA